MALDSVQPGSIGRCEDQFHVIFIRPCFDLVVLVGREVVQDDIQPLGTMIPAAEHIEETQDVGMFLALGRMAVQLIRLYIERGEQMLHAMRPCVGCTKPLRPALLKPAFAAVRLQG